MNEANQQPTRSKWRWLLITVNGLFCLGILGAAVFAVDWINRNEPVAEKVNTTRKSAALVETITIQRGTYSPRLVVLGTVGAARQISLSPRVIGQVVELSPEFVPGGQFKKGDLLLSIDPADFENAVSISESELEQAEASMEIEKARQRLAEKELKLLEGSIDETNRGLVMREPQIASLQAEISAAEAAVERAKLDLDRTKIHSPFDAQVLTQSVNIGSQVRPGDELGQLVGLDEYWITAAVPVRSLRWVQFPDAKRVSDSSKHSDSTDDKDIEQGSKVILRNPDAWGPDIKREARVSRLIGTLDQQTRLARVLITVKDPLGQESNTQPLILNTLLETEIEGRPIEDVVRLDREFIHDQDTVWVMKDDKLKIRETEIVFRDADYAYIREGLDDGDEVVTTTLATVADGVGLKRINKTSVNGDAASNESSRAEAKE